MKLSAWTVLFLLSAAMVSCICVRQPTPGTPTGPVTFPQTATSTPAPTTVHLATETAAPRPTSTDTPAAKPLPAEQGTAPASGILGRLKAESLDTAIRLSWPAQPDAQGYLVYRSRRTESLNYAPITDTQYEDIGLTNGQAYSYTVVAVDGAGRPIWHSTEADVVAGGG